jgi:hypothetical protein
MTRLLLPKCVWPATLADGGPTDYNFFLTRSKSVGKKQLLKIIDSLHKTHTRTRTRTYVGSRNARQPWRVKPHNTFS